MRPLGSFPPSPLRPSVQFFLLRINSVQCPSRSFDEAHHRAALEFGLRWRICPDLFWLIDRDVVPDDARTIMLSHRVRKNPVSVPVLLDPRIVNASKRYG